MVSSLAGQGTRHSTEPGSGAVPQSADTKKPIFTVTFVMAWVINFSQYLIFYLLVTTMAMYAVKEFAASNVASGLASSVFVIVATR